MTNLWSSHASDTIALSNATIEWSRVMRMATRTRPVAIAV